MSYIGTTFSLVAETPTTEDQSGYEALTTPTEVGRVVSVSAIGDTYEDLSETLLKIGRTVHNNGAADGGEVTITIDGEDFTDAGLSELETAEGTNTNYTFVYATTKQTYYCQGIVKGVRTRDMETSTKAGLVVTLHHNTGITRVAAA